MGNFLVEALHPYCAGDVAVPERPGPGPPVPWHQHDGQARAFSVGEAKTSAIT